MQNIPEMDAEASKTEVQVKQETATSFLIVL